MKLSHAQIEDTQQRTTVALSEIPFFKFLSQTEAVQEVITERHLNEIFKRFQFRIYAPGTKICMVRK